MSIAQNDNSTEEEQDWGHQEHHLDILVVLIAACEWVLSLAVDEVDEAPPIDRESKEGNELGQRQPSRLNRVAVVPFLKEFRACINIRHIGGQMFEHWAEKHENGCATCAKQKVLPVGLGVSLVVGLFGLVSRRHDLELGGVLRRRIFHSIYYLIL